MRYLIKNMTKEKEEFEKWCLTKQALNKKEKYLNIKIGEIRWGFVGKNIGSEIYGKGELFSRPILVFKKVYNNSCLILPLTSKYKTGNYFYTFMDNEGKTYCAILPQVRYLDKARIGLKKGTISKITFNEVKEAFIDFVNT